MKKYRVHWKSLKTGKTGNGTGTFTEAQALAIAQELNNENKGILHYWIEEV